MRGEAVYIGDGQDKLLIKELLHHFLAHAVDIHRIAGGEMNNTFDLFRRAMGVAAEVHGFDFFKFRSAYRTVFNHDKITYFVIASFDDGSYDFGNDIAGFSKSYEITDFKLLIINKIFVVERRSLDEGTGDADRL